MFQQEFDEKQVKSTCGKRCKRIFSSLKNEKRNLMEGIRAEANERETNSLRPVSKLIQLND